MFAAAGIVVTEISTPVNAPDLAVVNERVPAMPAQNATKNENVSGFEMTSERPWSSSVNVSGATPVHLNSRDATSAAAIAIGKPDQQRDERAARDLPPSLHDRDGEPRERAELGTQDHRPHDQDRRVEEDARPQRSASRAS